MQQSPDTLNLEQVLDVLRRRAWVIGLCVLVIGVAAFGITRRETKKYTATASLTFESNSLGQQVAGLSSGASSTAGLIAQHANQLELVRSGDMALKTAHVVGHRLTQEKVEHSLSISQQGESGVIDVSATANSPAIAAAIANTYVRQFVSERQAANRAYLHAALALVQRQLKALTPSQRTGQDGLQLQNRAQTLRLLSELGYDEAKVAQEAFPPGSPSSPNVSRNTILGLVLGLLLGLGIAFATEHFDRRVRSSKELEDIYGRPLLGVVPHSRALSSKRGHGAALPSPEAEALRLIGAQVHALDIERRLHMILITSPDPGDGKTTVARCLSQATSRLGARVLLLEADLRHPNLAKQLGVTASTGLTDVLLGAASIDQAMRTIDVTGSACSSDGVGLSHNESADRSFDVLLAGASTVLDPAHLLAGAALEGLLEQIRRVYDLVVIDAPPPTAVSDGFPLLRKVDGVVVIGRIGHSQRDSAERLRQVLDISGAPLLGVVANDVKHRRQRMYGHPNRGTQPRDGAVAPESKAAHSPESLQPAAKL
jgi:Mrp family chromosome partitioning ATPase/capsular polysaccharide biosynthesis protein